MTNLKTRLMGPGFAQATINAPSSISVEARTVELVWSTGAPVVRSDAFGQFNEVLSMAPAHVDLSRLRAGAPLLDSHDINSLRSIIGVVESASLKDGVGTAKVRFASDPASDAVFTKVKEGIIKSVSIGYRIRKAMDRTKPKDPIPTYEAVDWQPYEISLVSVPADASAQIRNQDNKISEVEILQSDKETRMPSENKDAILAERTRQSEIREAVRVAKLDSSFADELCNSDISADDARKRVMTRLAEAQPEPIRNVVRVDVGLDQSDKRRSGFESALLHRLDRNNFPVTEESKPIYGRSLIQQIEYFIPRNYMESDSSFAKRTLTSSDLPVAIASATQKVLQKQYDLEPKTYTAWCGSDTLNNYKPTKIVKTESFPNLLPRNEDGEYKYGKIEEDHEEVSLKDFGVITAFSSQMVTNDSLGVLQTFAQSQGRSAARLDNRLAYEILTGNPTMADGNPLFHTTHGNVAASGGAINATTFGAAVKAMRSQKTIDELEFINAAPSFLIVGLEKEAEAKAFLATINPTTTSQVNVWSNFVQLIVDPLVPQNNWFLVADKSRIDGVKLFRLQGNESPTIQQRVRWSTDALELKVSYTVIAAAVEHRSLYYNQGA